MERAFWIVSLIILLTDALFILVNYLGTQNALYENLAHEGIQQETTFHLNLRNQGLHMQQFATYLANQPAVRDLFLEGRRAVAEEGGGPGGERAAQIRQDLFDLISPGWQKVTGRYQVRQLHFHMGPGDTSFLRVHKPGKFGDDLSTIRHTITHAIRDNAPTHGFESGRVYAGIRGVVPIAVEGNDGSVNVAGALEAGSSFRQMLKVLEVDTGASYSVLLTDDYFHDTHWPDFAKKLKVKNPLVGDWYIEGSSDQATVRQMLTDPAVLSTLGQREAVISKVSGTSLAVFSFPFRDYLRTIDPQQQPIGVVLTWRDATAAIATADAILRTNLLLGLIGFLVVETLLFTAWKLARRRLQRVIDAQLSELSETNFVLQKEIGLRMQSERRLKNYQTHLEAVVDERTASLKQSVDALQTEIQQRTAIEGILQHERDQARVTLRSIADGVITADIQRRVQYLNPAAEELTGWSQHDAIGRHLTEVFPARDMERSGTPLNFDFCTSGKCDHRHGENTELTRHSGEKVTVEHSVSPIRGESGEYQGLVLVFHDDTEARELAVQLSYQASHDALTGLINRRAIEIELAEALRTSHSNHEQHAFLYLDLDQFKIVNDTCGHIAGDELLRQVGKILQQKTRHSDRLARLGGDEFGLLLRNCPVEKSREIAEELLEALTAFRFVWDDRSFKVGVSIGVSLIEHHSESVESILSMADSACYLAKDKGRSRVQLSLPDDAELIIRQGEMHWVSRIQQAISEDRLVLYGQPIVPVSPDLIEPPHQETLVRMIDENGELIAPNAFIPAAERYGMMHDVDRWIVARSFRFIEEARRLWPNEPAATYSINLSGETMADEGILAFIREQFVQHHVDPQQICFEVTETAAIANLTCAIDLIGALKQDGCRFALDDFGSGLSSFGYLKALPVDYLKIDGAFVKNLDSEPVDRVMVQAINSVGHAMNLKTIAEFVESDAIMQELKRIGVDYAQGYGIGRPAALR
jgi:diguanylate cyclase (GGDEF)-like protein/PAS domain S-box-containing protein